MEFKPEQQKIIDSHGKNLIVSASAGSGKTTVMIARIIKAITSQKQKIKEVLVLTYTKASAEEMKQKLISALYEEATNNPSLLSQIDDVSLADISTIHAFFQKTLKKNFMSVGLNSGFEIIDETQSFNFQEKAFENALAKHRKSFGNNLIKIYSRSRNENTLKELVLKLNNFFLVLPDKDKFCKSLSTKIFTSNNAEKILNEEICYFASSYENLFSTILQKCSQTEEKLISVLNAYISFLQSIHEKISFYENYNNLMNVPESKKFSDKEKSSACYASFEKTKDSFKAQLKKYKAWNFNNEEETKEKSKQTQEVVEELIKLTLAYQNEYAIIKLENNVLDYDDLEKYMLKLLENQAICDEIKNSYAEICVDEYQDANRVQEAILQKISKDNNRFMVGDVKQSIYGFRQAEPDIFLENQELFEKDVNGEVCYLTRNFRSDKKILDFVNTVFSKIMTEKYGKIDYAKTSMFVGEAEYQPVENQNLKPVEIDIVVQEEKKEKEEAKGLYKLKEHISTNQSYSTAMLEAFIIAKKIQELVFKKIYISKEKCTRKVEYGDITVLLRGRSTYLNDFCKVLSSFNIPLFANTNTNLYEDTDIELIINVLKLVVNPNNDIPLISVLHSVFGDFDFDELAEIRLKKNDGYFYEAFFSEEYSSSKKDNFNQMLKKLSYQIDNLGIFKALTSLVEEYDFSTYLLQKHDGFEKVEKLKKFINDFQNSGFNFNLFAFLDYMEQNIDKVKSPSYNGGENCVNVTTIHSSKGLEYPIVILANAGQDLNSVHGGSEIVMNDKLGVALKNYNLNTHEKSTIPSYEAISLENKNKEFAEKLRLLYVALTRAKNHLIIVGTVKKLDFSVINNNYQIAKQKTYLDLIINSLSSKKVEAINNRESVEEENLRVNVVSSEYSPNFMHEKLKISKNYKPQNLKILEDYYNFKYPHNTTVAIKNTVTGLLKEENFYSNITTSPQTLQVDEHKIVATTDIGIAYHKVMESLDFNCDYSIDDIINIIHNINIESADKVDANKIFDCYNKIKTLKGQTFLKEQKFVMQVKHNDIVENGTEDKVLVQGMVDLICLGKENVIVDYKYSSIKDEKKLIKKYEKQLKLYKMATEKALNIKIHHMFIYQFNLTKFIPVF